MYFSFRIYGRKLSRGKAEISGGSWISWGTCECRVVVGGGTKYMGLAMDRIPNNRVIQNWPCLVNAALNLLAESVTMVTPSGVESRPSPLSLRSSVNSVGS